MDLLNIGTVDQFATVRAVLRKANYTEAELCRRIGITKLEDFEENTENEQTVPWDSDAAGVLFRLFIEGRYAAVDIAERHLGSEALQAMADLGLVRRDSDQPNQLFAKACLVPSAGLWLATDRWNLPDRALYYPGDDIVYNPIGNNTLRFIKLMPELPTRNFLDLCSGSGVAALHASKRFAQHSWAADIAERSTNFAEFNRYLNAVQNMTPVTGDLYSPVADVTFDYIVAHPPYVPVLRPKYIFYDGGDDGEQILRRVIAEAPARLAPGGTLFVLAMSSDRDLPYEQRIRQWLGDQHAEFDIGVFPIRFLEPHQWASQAVLGSPKPIEDRQAFKRLFEERQVRTLVYGPALIRRHKEPSIPVTVRRNQGTEPSGKVMLQALDAESGRVQPGAEDRILETRYRANRAAELQALHKMDDTGWKVEQYKLQTTVPFTVEARVESWAVHAMMYCDGQHTVREVFDILVAEEVFPPQADAREFARALGVLASGGFLLS